MGGEHVTPPANPLEAMVASAGAAMHHLRACAGSAHQSW